MSGGVGLALQGVFQVDLHAADPDSSTPAYAALLGRVFDGPTPERPSLILDVEQGGCQLLVAKESPSCSDPCGASALCTDEDVCTPFPNPQDVGDVRVTGLAPSEFVMSTSSPQSVYQPASSLGYPPCAEGDSVSVETAAFRIDGKCIAPFTLLGAEPLPVVAGEGLPLTWVPPGQPEVGRVQIALDLSKKGGLKGVVDCDVPDTGFFEIPEPLVTKLVSLGLAGFPRVTVARVSTAYSATRPMLKLAISSQTKRYLDAGVLSCKSDGDCPNGRTCQADLTCSQG